MTDAQVNGAKRSTVLERIAERFKLAEEDVRDRPFSHPVATGWYYEDVAWLLREIERLEVGVGD